MSKLGVKSALNKTYNIVRNQDEPSFEASGERSIQRENNSSDGSAKGSQGNLPAFLYKTNDSILLESGRRESSLEN